MAWPQVMQEFGAAVYSVIEFCCGTGGSQQRSDCLKASLHLVPGRERPEAQHAALPSKPAAITDRSSAGGNRASLLAKLMSGGGT